MTNKSIISADQFDTKFIAKIFEVASLLKKSRTTYNVLTEKVMATLFYEPSTRTRLSFESAMLRLGGKVISTENASEFSSASKGETLEDTIRVINSFSDVIVLRHFLEGASKTASAYSNGPIINAGDGKGEHPTQALLDLYTIFSSRNLTTYTNLNGIKIAMIGDLANGRTIHSLSQLLSLYKDVSIVFVSPAALAIPDEIKAKLQKSKTNFIETDDLNSIIPGCDVVYQTRIQKERFVNKITGESEYLKYFGKYIIDSNTTKLIKKDAIIMHPLPRVNEISPEVDSDPRAIYFKQVQNGLFVRMAILLYLFDKNV